MGNCFDPAGAAFGMLSIMRKSLLVALLGVIASASTMLCAAAPQLHPKVVIVAYFEVGKDTGDTPGEVQFWVERNHLDRTI